MEETGRLTGTMNLGLGDGVDLPNALLFKHEHIRYPDSLLN